MNPPGKRETLKSIAIVGAGCSGLAAAHTLRDAGHTVTVFERSNEVGGRAATRRRQGFTYDHGAQYIKGGSAVSSALITGRFRAADLVDIAKPVWIFDQQGHIQEGDPLHDKEPKWTYRSGLDTLARRMAQDLDIRLRTRIGHLRRIIKGWSLFDSLGHPVGEFERILIAVPAGHALELIEASLLPVAERGYICVQLRKASYRPLISVMLGYQPAPHVRPYYALVNTDKTHALSWLAWEHEKSPERVPEQAGLLIAQMAPHYSREWWWAPSEEVIRDVAKHVATLLDEPLSRPCFTDLCHWRDALPAETANAEQLNAIALPLGLAFCGDAYVGGRVHLALEHGVAVARQIAGT
jgi:renalase